MKAVVEGDLAGARVVMGDQRLGVVEQQLLGHTAEVLERTLETVEPSTLALVAEGGDETAPRKAERRHAQEDTLGLAGDDDRGRAEVDLQLPPGWRLEAHRDLGRGHQLAAQLLHGPLDRARGDGDPMPTLELLPDHIGVAAMPAEALGQPRQPRRSLRPATGDPATGLEVAAHRHVAAAELDGDPPHTPAQRL